MNLPIWPWLTDVLDIAVVGFVIYRLLLLMRGRRAMQMFIGLFMILVAAQIAAWIELDTLNWLLSGLKGVWIIVFVILFQDDLRTALARIGQSRILRLFVTPPETEILPTVVQAARQLSEKSIGALIALERNARLGTYIRTGRMLNASASAGLLVTIFTPGTPLHDGAVIISGGQIVAAHCTFPLSQDPYLMHTLGTRHRAAVGLTEETDAVVIVVSEETGHISLALGGVLERNLSPDKLSERLSELFKVQAGTDEEEVA
jgi:diadenylate cyclase